MTSGPGQGAWDRLAVALGDGRDRPEEETARGSDQIQVPSGWASVRDALTASGPSRVADEEPETDDADDAAVPAGWGQVRRALRSGAEGTLGAAAGVAPSPAAAPASAVAVEPAASAELVEGPEADEAGEDDRDDQRPARPPRAPRAPRPPHRPLAGLGPAWSSLSARAGEMWSTLWGKVATAVVAVAVIVAIVLAIVLRGGGLPSNAAFAVNGKAVTVSAFKSQLSALNGLYGVKAPNTSDAKAYDAFLRAAAQALAVNMVLDNAGAKRHLTVSAKAARDTLDQTVNQNYGGNTAAFTQALSAQNLTEADVVTAISHQQMVQKLFPQIAGTVNVTAAQIQQYYQAHTAQLGVPETRAISRIVVSSQASAQSIVTQLKQGGSFATLASQQSADTATKSKGGVLGTLSQSDLSGTTPAFAKAAFAAAPNAAFGPVQDQGLWQVGEVTQVVPPAAATFDAKTQAAIKVIITDQVQLARWTAWLAGQIKAAHITYAATYRPAHPDQPPNVQIPQLTGESIRNSTIGSQGTGQTGTGTTGSGATGSGTPGSTPAP